MSGLKRVRDSSNGRFTEGERVRLLDALIYDESSASCLRWRDGTPAGGQDKDGYWILSHNNRQYKAHRVIMNLHGISVKGKMVDHIDRNPANCKLSNLRVVNHSNNCRNSALRKCNTSGHKGVSWHSQRKKWTVRVRIGDNSLYKSFGLYDDFELACLVSDEVRAKYHKEFACNG